MPACTNPAVPGCAYCSDNTGGVCQPCYDAAHAFLLCPAPFDYVLTIGWGLVVNQEYHKLYGRDVLESELWPITGAMAQANMTIPQIDALIVAQSGAPTRQQPILPLPSAPAAPAAPAAPRTAVPAAPASTGGGLGLSGQAMSYAVVGGMVLLGLLLSGGKR